MSWHKDRKQEEREPANIFLLSAKGKNLRTGTDEDRSLKLCILLIESAPKNKKTIKSDKS